MIDEDDQDILCPETPLILLDTGHYMHRQDNDQNKRSKFENGQKKTNQIDSGEGSSIDTVKLQRDHPNIDQDAYERRQYPLDSRRVIVSGDVSRQDLGEELNIEELKVDDINLSKNQPKTNRVNKE